MSPEMRRQDDNVRLVSIVHYISGALPLLLGSCYCAAIFQFNSEPISANNAILLGAAWLALFVLCGVVILSGDFARRRVNRRFSILASILLIPLFPLGTLIGALSLWVLTSPLAKLLYAPTEPSVT